MRQIQKKKRGKIQIDQIDIREVLDDLGIYYAETGKNVSQGWIGVQCCFCSDKSTHLGIRLDSGVCSCFRCGATGTIVRYLGEKLGDFNKAITILGDAVPRELKAHTKEQFQRTIHVRLPENASKKITPYHAGYLQKRGFNWKKLENKYNLHYTGPIGKFKNSIIVPVIKNYKLITFTSVNISDETNMRYRHLKDEESVISIKHHLFGVENTDRYSCILVEGLFDQFRMGDGAVAVFGVKISKEQKKLLTKFQKIVIAFDGDKAGKVGGAKLAKELSPFCDITLLELPKGEDPDSLGKKDIQVIKQMIGKN